MSAVIVVLQTLTREWAAIKMSNLKEVCANIETVEMNL